jgi:hypothetical protein
MEESASANLRSAHEHTENNEHQRQQARPMMTEKSNPVGSSAPHLRSAEPFNPAIVVRGRTKQTRGTGATTLRRKEPVAATTKMSILTKWTCVEQNELEDCSEISNVERVDKIHLH